MKKSLSFELRMVECNVSVECDGCGSNDGGGSDGGGKVGLRI